MRVLFFGSGEFAVRTFYSIMQDGHKIVAVVTQPDRQRGRGLHPTPTPLRRACQDLTPPLGGPPVLATADVNAADVVARLRAFEPDVGYVAAFGQKIGPELLGAFPAGMINLHGSLLPQLRGAAPVQWAILNGLEETGVTVFRLVSKMDAGPILVQRRIAIRPDETAAELHDRLADLGRGAVRAALAILADDPTAPGTPQDHAAATLARKLTKADSHVAFDGPAAAVARRIRGLWSWPGAACWFVAADGSRDEPVTLACAVPAGRSQPGAAVHQGGASPDDLGRITESMTVQTAEGEIEVLELQPAGGRLMAWRDFVNGRRVKPGDRFRPVDPT